MAFRADEQAKLGRDSVIEDFITRNIPAADRKRSIETLDELLSEYGPVVLSYPSWHPLMSANGDKRDLRRNPQTKPSLRAGYQGLDHNILLRNAFITCPRGGAQIIIDSVNSLQGHQDATISAEELDVPLYDINATPVLVKCSWHRTLEVDGTIPKRVAVGLLLEQEVPCWRWAKVAETWENMRRYILGTPRGSKSSLFVNQETGNALKVAYTALIKGGLFGPIYE